MHHCDTISNRSSPSHFTKDSPSNLIFPKSERGELSYINSILVVIHVNKQVIKNLCQCLLGKSKRKLFEKRGNAHTAIHLRTINQFLKLVYLHVSNSQYTFYI